MKYRREMNIKQKILSAAAISSIALTSVFLTGCGGGDLPGMSSSSSSAENAVMVSQTSILINENAENNMCNNALKLKVTGVQRRPTSVFFGSSIQSGSGDDIDSSSERRVSEATATDIVIQVDVSFTWNPNTFNQQTNGASKPSKLGDILKPGSLMYVVGNDSYGNNYKSADIITPEAEKDVNALAINAQWDYNILNSELPETSVVKNGSFLIRVPASIYNLKLMIVSPMGGQGLDEGGITNSEVYLYELPLA